MDIFLIIFIVIIVFVIGFILSRPFLNADQQQVPSKATTNYHSEYQEILKEIKSIQEAYPEALMKEEISDQLEKKKLEAARLLRLINEEQKKSL